MADQEAWEILYSCEGYLKAILENRIAVFPTLTPGSPTMPPTGPAFARGLTYPPPMAPRAMGQPFLVYRPPLA